MKYPTRARFAVAATGTLLVLATTSACAGSSGGTSPTGAAGDEVGWAQSLLSNDSMVWMVGQIQDQAKEQEVNLLEPVNADSDAAKQITDVSTLLNRGVKALLLLPVDAEALVPAIEQANAKGVPVVTVDSGADGGQIYMTVRADNVRMGESACEYMGDALGGVGTALNLQGDLASVNGKDRSDGFTDCMAEKFPNIEVVSKPMNWSPEECTTQAQTVLSTAKIDGLYMASDSVCLAGVQKVLKDLGRTAPIGSPDHLVTVAIDGSPAALDAIREGTLDATVSQPLDLYASLSVQYLKDALEGKTFEPGPTDHDSEIVANGDSLADLLPSPTVTSENADDASLWGNG